MTSVGDYDLDEQIGAGASGSVWRAHSRGPVARAVALKRLRAGGDRRDLERMRREAVVLTELDPPHVVRVLEVLQDGDGLALAMQLAPGGSLADLLAERGRLAPGEVVAVAAPAAAGWGGRGTSDGGGATTESAPPAPPAGTPPPPAADIYSLGVVCYQAL